MPADRRRPTLPAALLALPLALAAALSAACGGDALPWADGDAAYGDGTWHGTMDTLEDGTVVVRNPAQGVWTEEQAWRIEEEVRIGARSGQGPEVFGRISALAVDSLGRVWVADGRAGELRVFGRDGEHVRTVGGKGEGPREFRSIGAIEFDGRARVVVVDPFNVRYSVWDTAGRHLETRRRPYHAVTGLPWLGGFGADGRFWDVRGSPRLPGSTREAVAHDTAFEPVTSHALPVSEDPEAWTEPGGFPRDLVFRLDPPENVWFSRPWRPRIVQRRLSGDTVRVIDWDVEPPVRSEERRREILQRITGRLARVQSGAGEEGSEAGSGPELSDVPERDPLYDALWLDGRGHLWAVPYRGVEPFLVDRFHLFDPDGRYLGPATSDVPLADSPPPTLRDGRIWAVTEDTLDVEYVVRGRIVRPDGG